MSVPDALDVVVAYVYPITGEAVHEQFAQRFIASYAAHPAGRQHRLLVVCNGGEPRDSDRELWSATDYEFVQHDDAGWDIGAFLSVARSVECDVLVCLGGTTEIVADGWLERMCSAFERYGPGLFGTCGSFERDPHIRTGAFWCDPALLAAYPLPVVDQAERYAFEAGAASFTRMTLERGLPCMVVTPDRVCDLMQSRRIANTFRRGDQSNTLTRDRSFDAWNAADPSERRMLSRLADVVPGTGMRSRVGSALRALGLRRPAV